MIALRRKAWGRVPSGEDVEAFILEAGNVEATVLTFGATLQALCLPDRHGHSADVLLGFDDLAGYADARSFFGPTVGRVANRIADGRFTLDGHLHELDRNEGRHTLHGGPTGLDLAVWQVGAVEHEEVPSVTMHTISPAGASGFPGELAISARFALDRDGTLRIDYNVETTAPTVVNLTNHAVFNLAGEGAEDGIAAHELHIPASAFLSIDAEAIPIGDFSAVAGTAFDFRTARAINAGLRNGADAQIAVANGYNHCFVLQKGETREPALAARLQHPPSGRWLEIHSTAPGLQFYTSNHLDGNRPGKRRHLYRMGDGIALEPQGFPNAPNEPRFPSVRLDPGQRYRHIILFRTGLA